MNERYIRLVRKNIPSIPDVGDIIKEEVLLGKRYKILDFCPEVTIYNKSISRRITIDCYYVQSVDIDERPGLMPVELFGD